MRHNEIERAVDTVLSGLTTTPARQEELIRRAMESRAREKGSRPMTERAAPVKVKLRFSLSFGLSHMIVAAIVVVIVMVAPLFAPGRQTSFNTWQTEDGEYYMVQGEGITQSSQVADADDKPNEYGVFECETQDEAAQYFGTAIPAMTWLPDGWAPQQYIVVTSEYSRTLNIIYLRGEGSIVYTVYESYDGLSYTYVEQDGEGAHITLSDGRVVYVTHNVDRLSVSWTEGSWEFFFSGDVTREEAIRMAESIKTK